MIERTVYEPYGAVLNRPLEDGHGYAGHVVDASTGLSYMQQRYMDPAAGVFLSIDPVGAGASGSSFNRYRYANGNPYRFVDPDGREAGAAFRVVNNMTNGARSRRLQEIQMTGWGLRLDTLWVRHWRCLPPDSAYLGLLQIQHQQTRSE